MKNEMTCKTIEPRLTALALGELTPAEAAEVRAHLAACASCRAASQDICATLDVVRAALAEAPAVAPHLDTAHRARALNPAPRRRWVETIRELLDLPERGPIETSQWPFALARAALIFIIPLAVVFGLVVPGLHDLWRVTTAVHRMNEPGNIAPAVTTEPDGYTVEILPVTEFAQRDAITTDTVASVGAPHRTETAATSPFDAAAEHWTGDSIVSNELPGGNKLGLGMKPDHLAVDLARETAPALAAELARARAATQQALAATIPAPHHDKDSNKPHFVTAVAAPHPPAATNKLPITNAPPASNPPTAK